MTTSITTQLSRPQLVAACRALEAIRDLPESDETWTDRIDEVLSVLARAAKHNAEPVHWLRCRHPLCATRWEGTSLEATYDEHLDAFLCPACGGASAVRDLGPIPEHILKFARITRDAFCDPRDRVWENAASELPRWFSTSTADLHRIIVHTALACGHRLPVAVLLDYRDVVAALSATTGTYLDHEPGWDILLAEGRQTFLVLERAACGDWPPPDTPAAFMAWFADEAAIQRDLAEDAHHTAEIDDRLAYAAQLDAIVAHLAARGVTPDTLPWENGTDPSALQERSA